LRINLFIFYSKCSTSIWWNCINSISYSSTALRIVPCLCFITNRNLFIIRQLYLIWYLFKTLILIILCYCNLWFFIYSLVINYRFWGKVKIIFWFSWWILKCYIRMFNFLALWRATIFCALIFNYIKSWIQILNILRCLNTYLAF